MSEEETYGYDARTQEERDDDDETWKQILRNLKARPELSFKVLDFSYEKKGKRIERKIK